MSGEYSPIWKRYFLYYVPFLFKVGPCGNYHYSWDRRCFCMVNEYCGECGGVYDFKAKTWEREKRLAIDPKEKMPSLYLWSFEKMPVGYRWF